MIWVMTNWNVKKKVKLSMKAHRVMRHRGSHIFYTIGSQMEVRLSPLHAGRPLQPRKIPGTNFCLRPSRPQGHSAAGRIRSIEKSNDVIRNRTRDLPACSTVPQPNMLPRAPYEKLEYSRNGYEYKHQTT
jgi:predicted RNA binding protein YcfA (HicA-like mRNA interferase family)